MQEVASSNLAGPTKCFKDLAEVEPLRTTSGVQGGVPIWTPGSSCRRRLQNRRCSHRNTSLALPSAKPIGEKYYDVNNDGFATAVDILMVINELNRAPTIPPAGEGSGGGGIGGGGAGGSVGGEADNTTTPLVPGKDLATQYYSQNPLQVVQIPGTTGCICEQCTAITEVAVGRVSAAATAKKTISPAPVKPLKLKSFAEAKKESNLQTRAKVVAPHIDGSLLHTIAAAAPKPAKVIVRRGRR